MSTATATRKRTLSEASYAMSQARRVTSDDAFIVTWEPSMAYCDDEGSLGHLYVGSLPADAREDTYPTLDDRKTESLEDQLISECRRVIKIYEDRLRAIQQRSRFGTGTLPRAWEVEILRRIDTVECERYDDAERELESIVSKVDDRATVVRIVETDPLYLRGLMDGRAGGEAPDGTESPEYLEGYDAGRKLRESA